MKSLAIQLAVNPIIELQSLAKIKLKKQPLGARNEKKMIAPANLEKSTCQNTSRFEHEAKIRKTGTKSQNDTRAKENKERVNKIEGVVIRE